MKTVLFVNACINHEKSRTLRLADAVLDKLLEKEPEAEVVELTLKDAEIGGLTEGSVAFRSQCHENNDFSHDMFVPAKQFAAADEIVIAAPYWDLSFPAMLKSYIEQLCVNGLTFVYNEKGIPEGRCNASKMTYVTTAGGYLGDYNMGYDYVAAVCKLYFGIQQCECISAEGLDIWGNNSEVILAEAIESL